MFCRSFGIKNYFSTPFHPSPNSRCEQFGESLNKALRILTTEQKDWSRHLQAVAMSHRASSTSSMHLSPFEVLHAQPMQLFVDHGLMSEQSDSPSMQAYMRDVAPKLRILHQLAMQNSEASAARNRAYRNAHATPPAYKLADQVLLSDPTTKVGESPKLKRKWIGPYLITQVLDNYNYKLQCLKTGRDLKRPVHASRLRPLHQLDNDYRLPQPALLPTVFECSTSNRQLKIRITTGNILEACTDAIVHVADDKLSNTPDLSGRLFAAAGSGVLAECIRHAAAAAPLQDGHCLITAAGELSPIRRIVHIVRTTDAATVRAHILLCLHTADLHADHITSLAVPFFHEDDNTNLYWDISQQLADAVNAFDAVRDENARSLDTIEFVCMSVLAADVLTTVFNHVISASQPSTTSQTQTDENTTQSSPTPTGEQPSGWFEIEAVLKRRRQRHGDEYLVKWKGSQECSWVSRRDLSPAALQQYIRDHPP
jgi:O-acetyl-ADP-ribose deacetylase (regulator of RNase III)